MLHFLSSSSASSRLRPRFLLLLPNPPANLRVLAMSAAASISSFRPVRGAAAPVPSLGTDVVGAATDEALQRYTSPTLRRSGAGVAVVWFRNDLRILDNEALVRAGAASEAVLPVYCVDPRVFKGSTHYFGLENLRKKGLELLIRHGKPEDILPSIAKAVYAHKETCREDLLVEHLVRKALDHVAVTRGASDQKKPLSPKLQLIWGTTMHHTDDLPFPVSNLPDVYTQFRKAVESKSSVRNCRLQQVATIARPAPKFWPG